MADKRITELNNVTLPLNGSELLPIVQNGETKNVAASDLIKNPPIANTYENVTALLADQANQEEGYLYRVLASTLSYEPAPFGELILELTQTTGSLNDYKLAYSEFKRDLIEVIDDGVLYEKAGFYKLDEGSSITIETNAKSFEDDTVYFYEDDYFYVERKLVGNNSDDLPTYRDDYYNSLGIYVGYKIVSEETVPPPQINLNEVLILDDYSIPNNHYTVDIYDNTKSIKKGKIKKALTEDDLLIQGLLKMPYNSFFRVLKSNLIINGKNISHNFVFISDSVNETVTPYIRLLSGFKEDNSYLINKTILLDFEFTNEFIYDYENYQPITKDFTSDGSGLIINDLTLSHSNDMKTWIQQYINNNLTGTPPTIIGYENLDVSTKVSLNLYRLDVMYRNNSDLVCSATTNSFDRFKFNDQNKDVFKVIGLGSNTLERLDRTTAEDDFLADVVMVTSRAETDNDGTDPKGSSYGFGVEFNEPTRDADLAANGMTDTQASDAHEQSPATAIVTAKFKWLRNETGAPWGLIREACRATASNAGSYNIYRGFGQIDTAAAKTYIENNIDTWTGVNTTELAEYYDAISPYNTAVKLEEKTDKTPVVKKDLDAFLKASENAIIKELYLIESPSDNIKKAYSLTQNEGLRVDIGTGAPNYYTIYDNSATVKEVFQVTQTSLGGHVLFRPNGNIGFGVALPTEKLHVNGKIKATAINFTGLPTSATGLSAGDVWNDGGTLKIVT